MQLLRQEAAFLLDLPLRFSDLQRLYGRKPVGAHLQRCKLAVSRLRQPEALLVSTLNPSPLAGEAIFTPPACAEGKFFAEEAA